MVNKTSDAASVVTGKGKIVGGVLAVLAVLVVVAVVVINSGLFTATDIQIQGSEHVTKHDAIQLIDLPEGTSLFNVDPDQITEDLKQNPWVSGVDVQRQFPHTLIITPMERKVTQLPISAPMTLPGPSGMMTPGSPRCRRRSKWMARATSSRQGRAQIP
ncbi:MAG: cell division protein FtsQ/DivIB [Collinsella sp.]